MTYFVYILKDTNNNIYIGQTNNLYKRERQQLQKSKKAAKFIRDGSEFKLAYFEQFKSRVDAMRREKQLKGWTRAKKEALIKKDIALLKQL